jgi:hypothetical protein
MVTLETTVKMNGITAKDVYDFMLNINDADYQRWWKGTHLACHTVKKYPDNIGNIVYADEYVGKYRVKGYTVITRLVPYKEMVYQIKMITRIPAWFIMKFEDVEDGVNLVHTIKAGGHGIWRIFDPFIRLYLSKNFEKNVNEHAHEEFPMLAEMIIKDKNTHNSKE